MSGNCLYFVQITAQICILQVKLESYIRIYVYIRIKLK